MAPKDNENCNHGCNWFDSEKLFLFTCIKEMVREGLISTGSMWGNLQSAKCLKAGNTRAVIMSWLSVVSIFVTRKFFTSYRISLVLFPIEFTLFVHFVK